MHAKHARPLDYTLEIKSATAKMCAYNYCKGHS